MQYPFRRALFSLDILEVIFKVFIYFPFWITNHMPPTSSLSHMQFWNNVIARCLESLLCLSQCYDCAYLSLFHLTFQFHRGVA